MDYRLKPADYRAYRQANRRCGTYREVEAWLEECERAEQAERDARRKALLTPQVAAALRQRAQAMMAVLEAQRHHDETV
jgi:hypothetical protein